MKPKKAIILFGTVCMLNIMVIGCGSGVESSAKTGGYQTGEALPEERSDTLLKGIGGNTEDPQETADTETAETETETDNAEPSEPEATEDNGTERQEIEEIEDIGDIPQGDPIAGIVDAYDGTTITVRTPEDDMRYLFSAENVPILEGYSTEDAHAVEEDFLITVGDKVEVSYRGLLDDEKHPIDAVKIVVIIVE